MLEGHKNGQFTQHSAYLVGLQRKLLCVWFTVPLLWTSLHPQVRIQANCVSIFHQLLTDICYHQTWKVPLRHPPPPWWVTKVQVQNRRVCTSRHIGGGWDITWLVSVSSKQSIFILNISLNKLWKPLPVPVLLDSFGYWDSEMCNIAGCLSSMPKSELVPLSTSVHGFGDCWFFGF